MNSVEAAMADGVLLDTSFLISFADPTRKHHAVAVQFFKFFGNEGIPMFLSTIAAAEFHQEQPVTDLPLDAMVVLPFNLIDAMNAADLDFTLYKRTLGVARDALKDDFKLLGQVKAHDIAFVITEDEKSLYQFCRELREKHVLAARAIKLEDGFDKSHFDPAGQHDFEANLGEPPSRRLEREVSPPSLDSSLDSFLTDFQPHGGARIVRPVVKRPNIRHIAGICIENSHFLYTLWRRVKKTAFS